MSLRRFYALGTASQVPTRERNHNGYFLKFDDEGFLFDCGEGTQRQMIFSELSATQITKIFITHFHGDHCLGLAGIFQRLSLDKVLHTVQLFYPKSGQNFVNNLRNASIYHNVATVEEFPFENEGEIFKGKNFRIEAMKLSHTVECFGYRIIENDSFTMLPEKLEKFGIKGRDIGKLKSQSEIEIDGKIVKVEDCGEFKRGQVFAFVMDTRLCDNAFRLAENADLLVCESTYLKSEAADAHKNGHLTATQAAEIAQKSNANLLALTHFSQRYLWTSDFLKEAKKIHENSVAMKDGDFVDLPKRR
jgi:ribonuclease Z